MSFRTPFTKCNICPWNPNYYSFYSKNENMTLNDLKVACRISDIQQKQLKIIEINKQYFGYFSLR